WFGYVVNDYWDAPFDAGDEAKARTNFFVRHAVAPNQALMAAIGISAFLLIAFAQFGYQGVVALAIYLFIMWSYSAPPLHFKSRPVWGLVIHALFAQPYPYVVCLVLIGAAWTPLDLAVIAFTCLAALAGQLEQQIRDLAIDSETGRTFTTQVGSKTAAAFLRVVTTTLVLLVLLALADGTVPLYLVPYGLLALPTAVYRLAISRWQRRPPRLVYVSMIVALLYTLWGFLNF
ncbi:MAG TPA: UbiA family prenyltransferase, partial [Anaerolineae bacterium]